MTRKTLPRTLALLSLAAAGFLGTAAPAVAGPLRASASLTSDPGGVVNDSQASGTAFAAYPSPTSPVVTATATRRHLIVDSQAAGHSASFGDKYGGSADSRTAYALWNLSENRALTAEEAAPFRLSFNFNLSGLTSTSGDSHERSVGLAGGLTFGAFPFAVGFGDNAGLTQDPNGRVSRGNAALMNAVVDADYSLVHQGAAGGEVAFELQALSAIDATVYYDLWLESVTLVEETIVPTVNPALSMFAMANAVQPAATFDLGMGLGIKLLDDLGEIIVVAAATTPSAVPVPPSWALVLGGLALLPRRRRS